MKKLRALISVLLTVAITLSFSACSFRMTSFENLLRPPKMTGKYKDLQDAFEELVGTRYTLCTPNSGEFQSSFITYDCDSDGDEDALVLYSTDDEPDVAKLLYFKYDSGKWNCDKAVSGSGSSVDMVMFPDVDSDGNPEILVGWGLLSGVTNKSFSVYDVNDKAVKLISSYPYNSLSVLDVNGDGVEDIFTLTVDSSIPEILTGYARVYNYNSENSTLTVLSETKTDGNISSYLSVKMEPADDINYIYVEAAKGDHDSITELIYWDDETSSLVSPLFDSDTQATKLSWRNVIISSTDIDSDGFLEIPTSVEMKGSFSSSSTATSADDSVADSSQSVYFIKWIKYRDGAVKPVQYSVYNESGYYLKINSSWVGYITAIKTDGQIDFYRWSSATEEIGDLLFSICSYDSTDKDRRDMYSSYKQLKSSGNTNYAYRITDEGAAFGVKESSIEDGFILS